MRDGDILRFQTLKKEKQHQKRALLRPSASREK